MIGIYIKYGNTNKPCLVRLVPGLNFGISETKMDRLKENKKFQIEQNNFNLRVIEKEVQSLGEKHGHEIYENSEGAPIIGTALNSNEKPKAYLPTKSVLTAIKGIGAKSAEEIIELGQKSNWTSYSNMVGKIQKLYPTAKFTKSKEDKVGQ